jgi:hypothetical protein
MEKSVMTTDLARLLQTFFCQRLIQQRNVSRPNHLQLSRYNEVISAL